MRPRMHFLSASDKNRNFIMKKLSQEKHSLSFYRDGKKTTEKKKKMKK